MVFPSLMPYCQFFPIFFNIYLCSSLWGHTFLEVQFSALIDLSRHSYFDDDCIFLAKNHLSERFIS